MADFTFNSKKKIIFIDGEGPNGMSLTNSMEFVLFKLFREARWRQDLPYPITEYRVFYEDSDGEIDEIVDIRNENKARGTFDFNFKHVGPWGEAPTSYKELLKYC